MHLHKSCPNFCGWKPPTDCPLSKLISQREKNKPGEKRPRELENFPTLKIHNNDKKKGWKNRSSLTPQNNKISLYLSTNYWNFFKTNIVKVRIRYLLTTLFLHYFSSLLLKTLLRMKDIEKHCYSSSLSHNYTQWQCRKRFFIILVRQIWWASNTLWV